MSTYPPVTDAERDAALARIARRHQARDDSRWSEAGTEARDVLDYLRRAPTAAGLAAHDIWDELVLAAWVHWDERRRERERLHRARHHGLSYAELGRYLGIGTRQGARDYLDRLDALCAEYTRINHTRYGPATGDGATDPLARLAGTTRATRGADVHATRARRAHHRTRAAAADWITTHQPLVTATVRGLLEQTARVGIHAEPGDDTEEAGLGDYLHWLTQDIDPDLNPDGIRPDTMATLGLALGELRDHPTLAATAANHGLRHALAAADQLRATYAEQAGAAGYRRPRPAEKV
uniref:hypothetical protein n=1 Tax=Pseudonocardia sp. CA-138482 TaxID=3240023 RepID=UPI003F491B0E